ncbi:hypothetical protein TrVFT333_001849 [Trichoderma virens FT-333]|nr:hypothetical protein TrVFT333_001849 [Trichoderma virens FT-333]
MASSPPVPPVIATPSAPAATPSSLAASSSVGLLSTNAFQNLTSSRLSAVSSQPPSPSIHLAANAALRRQNINGDTRVTNECLTLALEAIEELRRLQDKFLDAFDVQISPSIDTAINRVTTLLDKIG